METGDRSGGTIACSWAEVFLHEEEIMAEEVKSIGKWAQELGVPEKKLKDAVKAAGIQPDAKKGGCSLYSRQTAEKAAKGIG